MARIRTIKPEFWTDGKIVTLPYAARLLFIGLWSFCDDSGYLPYDSRQIGLQVLPNDDEDCDLLLDILISAELVDVCTLSDGREALCVRHFKDHQKISHPTPSVIAPEVSGKKQSIPVSLRRALATKYGCKPGEHADCQCYYCGMPGRIWWPNTSKGTPGYWVAFSLEIDHFVAESQGGATQEDNVVLACRQCNRSKHTEDGLSRILRRIPENSGALRPEGKGKERKGREGKGKEDCSERSPTNGSEPSVPPESQPDGFLIFPCCGRDAPTWTLTHAKVAEYRESFPGVDVEAECRKALQWCRDNRLKRKTARGMPAFLSRWLSREQDRCGRGPPPKQQHPFVDPSKFKPPPRDVA